METASPWQQSMGHEGSKGLGYRKSCCLSVRPSSIGLIVAIESIESDM